MGVNCVGKLCENPIHFVCIFIVWRFFWPKILEINRALLKLFMHMKTHFSSISTYRDLSICDFIFLATLIYILYMFIYTRYLWEKKITVFHNLNLCIYTGCPKKSGNDHTSRAKHWRPLWVNLIFNLCIHLHCNSLSIP